MSQDPVSPDAPQPKKPSKPVTAAMIVGVLLAVGWAGWRVAGAARPIDRAMYLPIGYADRVANRPPRPAGPPALEGTITRRNDGAEVRIPGVRARFTKAKEAWQVEALWMAGQFPQDVRNTARARDIALSRPAAAAQAKVSPDQLAKLKALPQDASTTVPLQDADKAALVDLFAKHEAAPDAEKPAALKAIADRLRDAATPARPAAQAAAKQSAAAVSAVLSAEQIRTLSAR